MKRNRNSMHKKRTLATKYEFVVLLVFVSIVALSEFMYSPDITGFAVERISESTDDIISTTVLVSHEPPYPTVSDTVTVRAAASDPTGISSVDIYVNGTLRRRCNGFGSTDVVCTSSSTYAEGLYFYYAYANNTNGTVIQSPIRRFSVTLRYFPKTLQPVPQAAPQKESLSSIVMSHFPRAPTIMDKVTISADVSDPAGLKYVTIYADDLAIRTCQSTSGAKNLVCSSSRTYTAGQHSYKASVGNVLMSIVQSDVKYFDVSAASTITTQTEAESESSNDTTPPSVFVYHSPSRPKLGDAIHIVANASDSAELSNINIFVDKQKAMICFSGLCIYSFTAAKANYTYYATATDTSGNVGRDPQMGGYKLIRVGQSTGGKEVISTEASIQASDTTPPTVYVNHFPVCPTVGINNINITATATDDMQLRNIRIYYDSTFGIIAQCSSSPCSAVVNGTPGNHTYFATAEDAAGNIGRYPIINHKLFTVNPPGCHSEPSQPWVTHSPSNPVLGHTVNITASPSKSYANSNLIAVYIYLDNFNVPAKTCYSSPCIYSASGLSLATHNYLAAAVYRGGNTIQSPILGSKSFTVYQGGEDTSPPIVTITNPRNGATISTPSTTLRATTNENVVCKYSLKSCSTIVGGSGSGSCGAHSPVNMSITGGTSHSQILSELKNNYNYTASVNCTDMFANSRTASVNFFVKLSGGGGVQKIPE